MPEGGRLVRDPSDRIEHEQHAEQTAEPGEDEIEMDPAYRQEQEGAEDPPEDRRALPALAHDTAVRMVAADVARVSSPVRMLPIANSLGHFFGVNDPCEVRARRAGQPSSAPSASATFSTASPHSTGRRIACQARLGSALGARGGQVQLDLDGGWQVLQDCC
jgi:hypothetical protein